MNLKDHARVKLSVGELVGRYQDGLFVFKGVPYAAPPVGTRRWLAPEPVQPWDGIYQADRFRETAPQNPMLAGPELMGPPEPQSEDCLFLNIWSPGLDDARRPVMVWIHGGAFSIGSGSSPLYNGSNLARHYDVVVVTINYRLNLLGFLNLNEVTGGRIPATGNEGLLDQVAALQWVRHHIAAFGGDPANVTVFGESAGSMSIACLLAMPAARGLFHKAILESGVGTTTLPLAEAEKVGELFLDLMGIDGGDEAALRALSVEQLLAAELKLRQQMASPWEPMRITATAPVIDGRTLPEMPTVAVAKGSAKDIPLIIGTNLEEWKLFVLMETGQDKLDRGQIIERLSRFIPARYVSDIVMKYDQARTARNDDTSAMELLVAINTDVMFRIPALQLVEAQLPYQSGSVFNYLFTWRSPVADGLLGACHALEMGFVFGTHDDKFCGSGPVADGLSQTIQAAWTAFARTGRPAVQSLGEWPAYGERRMTMILDQQCRIEAAPYEAERRAWDAVGRLQNILL